MRLWIGLEHVTTSTADGDAICREDIATLVQNGEGHDWEVKCMMQALRALVGQGVRH